LRKEKKKRKEINQKSLPLLAPNTERRGKKRGHSSENQKEKKGKEEEMGMRIMRGTEGSEKMKEVPG